MKRIVKKYCIFIFLILSVSLQGKSLPKMERLMNIKSLNVNNGLSQNSVTSVIQDSRGFIWIGTYDGLNRFDGFNTIVSRHESQNPYSLNANRILCLSEAPDGQILIGTEGGGLNKYNPVTDRFTAVRIVGTKQFMTIQAISKDQSGHVWISSANQLLCFNYQSGNSSLYKFPPNVSVLKLKHDKHNNLWIGTSDGLFLRTADHGFPLRAAQLAKINLPSQESVTALYEDDQSNLWIGTLSKFLKTSIKNLRYPYSLIIDDVTNKIFPGIERIPEISDIKQDRNGDLWLSTRNAGLVQLSNKNPDLLKLRKVFNTQLPFCNLPDNKISTLLVDRSNTLWIGGMEKGIGSVNLSAKPFFTIKEMLSLRNGQAIPQAPYISAIAGYDSSLWIGTSDKGLFHYGLNARELQYQPYFYRSAVASLFIDKTHTLWIGDNQGLHYLNKQKKTSISALRNIVPRSITQDKCGRIWVATFEGIFIYDLRNNTTRKLTSEDGLTVDRIYCLYQDPIKQRVWAGTMGGGILFLDYDLKEKIAIGTLDQFLQDRSQLSNDHIWCIYRDRKNILWVGTDAGLNKLLLDGLSSVKKIEVIKNVYLRDKKIVAIQEDAHGSLWLSSSQGLYRYDVKKNNVTRYTSEDGLQSNMLTEASFQDDRGLMYFGGINGLNYFDPDSIAANPYLPQIAFTELKLFNHTVNVGMSLGGRVILEKSINFTDTVVLHHNENNFMLSFASLHYALPQHNRFRYKLSGYDEKWVETDFNQRFASYNNLDAGTYVFSLKSSNNDGSWSNEQRNITLIIQPAFWVTWWAKSIYITCISILVWFVFSHFKGKHLLENEIFKEKLENGKLQELNDLKLNFFTNITHELRTPLNLILGPTEELLDLRSHFDKATHWRLSLIHQNSAKLLNLINQILDLRKISSENPALMVSPGHLVQVLHQIKAVFDLQAAQKSLDYQFNADVRDKVDWFDQDKIEKIVSNLLSNAFKYTSHHGIITLSLSFFYREDIEFAKISIADDGVGIDADERSRIFDMYYQNKKQDHIGTGIGLALVKRLTEIHKGDIFLEDREKGSLFVVLIPVSRSAYTAEDMCFPEKRNTNVSSGVIEYNNPASDIKKRKKLLLLEDDPDQRMYIEACLKEYFDVLACQDAPSGFKTAVDENPDIILSDLLMPDINGIDFCESVKSDVRTRHIPVLIHTVSNNGVYRQKAWNAGADDIIVKPINYALLACKINNILKTRSQLTSLVYKQQITQPSAVEVPDQDHILLRKTLEIIEKHMSDPDFSVEKLCSQIGISRMHLHRRLHMILGKTTSELLRDTRMKRAGQLLASGSVRISEAMYEVGISNNSRFNRYFREMYGLSPKEYIRNNADNQPDL